LISFQIVTNSEQEGVCKKVPNSKATILTVNRDEGTSAILFSGITSSLTVIVQYMMDELLKLQKTNPEEKVRCRRIGVGIVCTEWVRKVQVQRKVQRVVIADTVEDQILKMQKRKGLGLK
jgi:hypothetical protein